MDKLFLLLFVLEICCINMAAGLTCESCQLTSCPVIAECKAGMVMDVCNCCTVCAQTEGDECGGKYDLSGKCGMNLFCDKDFYSDESSIGVCKKCDEVIYTGCNVIQGVCQCSDSCTSPFDYADYDSCMNSVQAYDEINYCRTKSCPTDVLPNVACPEDSYRPPSKLSADGCCQLTQECVCLETTCHPPPECPAGRKVAEIRKGNGLPGTCCSHYTCVDATAFRCEVGNSSFTDGQVVSTENCLQCRCKDGVVTCDQMICHTPTCEWSALLPGECCPECQGCVSVMTGESYLNGESWEEQSSCVQCQCVKGQTHCTAAACERRCHNPKMVLGQCCPVCDEDEVMYSSINATVEVACPDSLNCPSNCKKKVTVEVNGCSVCLCEDDVNMCPGSGSCNKVCPHGYKKDRQQGCAYCRCNACQPFSCNLVCLYGYVKDSLGCNTCECKDGTRIAPAGACFTSEGKTYNSGDSWFDGCRMCYCENGREMCSLINCPVLDCTQPLVRVGDCCPSCPSGSAFQATLNISTSCVDVDGSEHIEGDAWQLDTCSTCLCHQGTALCETQRCPPTLCIHPIQRPGHCCAECSDAIESRLYEKEGSSCVATSGTTFDHGSIWKVSDCQSCTCQNGVINCFSQTCPILQCDITVQQKGKCCPKCTGQGAYDKVCVYERIWYKHLDTWVDDDLQCTCYHGQAECESVQCIACSDAQVEGLDEEEEEDAMPLSIGLPTIIILSILLLLFAVIIMLLAIVIVQQKKKERSKPSAIPRILERRAIVSNAYDSKKRPKSTNLEFLHSTNDNRYNNANTDSECFRPLVETNHNGNEYVQC